MALSDGNGNGKRHGQGLIHAADGYARSTGKVGVCLVTSGPGATNLVTGIATANYDSVPLVCFTGQVQTHLIGNDTFQEVDFVGITRSICKYAVMVRKREDLPKDVQRAYGSDFYPKEITVRGYRPNTPVHMGQLNKALDILDHAEKPVFLAGGGVNIAHANKEMTQKHLRQRQRLSILMWMRHPFPGILMWIFPL